MLEKLPSGELESMRFSAEMLHGKSHTLTDEAEQLLTIMRKEQLAASLTLATAALKKAEAEGNEAEVARLMEENKLLTARIAKLHT
jgi:hypothetical protein